MFSDSTTPDQLAEAGHKNFTLSKLENDINCSPSNLFLANKPTKARQCLHCHYTDTIAAHTE